VAFEQWQVVVVPFPLTDRRAKRRRPALVVSRPEALGTTIGHSVLAMITSAGHSRWPLDVPLADLEAAGLPAQSVVRMKLFTLDDSLLERSAGRLAEGDARAVEAALGRLFGAGRLCCRPSARFSKQGPCSPVSCWVQSKLNKLLLPPALSHLGSAIAFRPISTRRALRGRPAVAHVRPQERRRGRGPSRLLQLALSPTPNRP